MKKIKNLQHFFRKEYKIQKTVFFSKREYENLAQALSLYFAILVLCNRHF